MATRQPAAKKRSKAKAEPEKQPAAARPGPGESNPRELVIVTGMSGAGKASALKTFEDLGFYSVDNLPLELIPRFADLVAKSAEIERAALVVDVREGSRLDRFPATRLILALTVGRAGREEGWTDDWQAQTEVSQLRENPAN